MPSRGHLRGYVWIVHNLKDARRAIERAVLGVCLKDKLRQEIVRKRMKVRRISKLPWELASYIYRKTDGGWRKGVIE